MSRIRKVLIGATIMVQSLLGQAALPWSEIPPVVTTGRIERLSDVPSRHVDPRPIDVWLPPGYSPAKRYSVLYMQDGQNLFDASQTWNKASWNVHEALSKLMQQGRVQETIVVGIPNSGKYRYSEYFPEKYLALLPAEVRQDYVRRAQWGRTLGDAYLRYIVEDLKPVIDKTYSTRTEAAGTFLMGSSMGGMVSLYALCEYPQVFGGVAALSTHWIGKPGAWGAPERLQNATLPLAAFNYLRQHLPKPGAHRLYFDHGTTGLDAVYGVHQDFVDAIGKDMGFTAAQWQSRIFQGADHTETDWAARVDMPLLHLLGKP
jgi:pimeloyl-ACP methyl ester carboxylesterase